MQNLKIAALQFNQIWENKIVNREIILKLLSVLDKVDLILLPEMFDTGFSMNISMAEEWGSTNTSLSFLQEIATKYNSAIYTSFMIKEGNQFKNRGVFIKPNGTFEIYDKRKVFGLGGEDKCYSPGSSETIVDYLGWKFNCQICYDLRFPEMCRNRLLENGRSAYDVLLYVANWPEKRIEHWKSLLKARAIENQCYVIGVNRVGIDGNNLSYSGDSSLFDALGNQILTYQSGEQLFCYELNIDKLLEIRLNLPFLKDC